jgi:glutamate---cysteine ligase / carboxylate-amine ligase
VTTTDGWDAAMSTGVRVPGVFRPGEVRVDEVPGARAPGDHDAVRTVGVEEELLVVDPAGRPVPLGPAALETAARRGEGETVEQHDLVMAGRIDVLEGAHLVPELKEEQIELGTRVCSTLTEVDRELRHWRGEADRAAVTVGARVAALATSPVAVEPHNTAGERFDRMAAAYGIMAHEQLTSGCHVHVSVDGDDEGVGVLDRIRVWLPVLTALSANSPFWFGRDTGYASYRAQAWNRWPSAGINGPYGTPAAYHRLVADLLATGTLLDEGMAYFDARLSARWPTVEVRVADVCLRVDDAVLLAGLVRGLVDTAAADWRAGRPVPEVRSELLRLAAWRASHSGLDGDLVHPATGRPAPAADVVAALVEHVRPALADNGDLALVEGHLARLLSRGPGSTLQRAVFIESGDLQAVVRAGVEATHSG